MTGRRNESFPHQFGSILTRTLWLRAFAGVRLWSGFPEQAHGRRRDARLHGEFDRCFHQQKYYCGGCLVSSSRGVHRLHVCGGFCLTAAGPDDLVPLRNRRLSSSPGEASTRRWTCMRLGSASGRWSRGSFRLTASLRLSSRTRSSRGSAPRSPCRARSPLQTS